MKTCAFPCRRLRVSDGLRRAGDDYLTITIAAVLEQITSVDVADRLRDLIRDRAPAETADLLNAIVDNAIAKAGTGRASLALS